MKVTYPMSAEGIGAGLLWKLGVSIGAGVLGASIMAAMDPPTTKRELFKQAAVAGVGSMVFGPVALTVVSHYAPFLANSLETAVPVYFLVGALAWGVFGAIAKLRVLIRDRAANALAVKFGVAPEAPKP